MEQESFRGNAKLVSGVRNNGSGVGLRKEDREEIYVKLQVAALGDGYYGAQFQLKVDCCLQDGRKGGLEWKQIGDCLFQIMRQLFVMICFQYLLGIDEQKLRDNKQVRKDVTG